MKRRLLCLLTFACFLAGLGLARAADVIPANRRFDGIVGATGGTGYGVPGGIYQYRSRTVVNATGLSDTAGGTDYTNTIRDQLDALSENQCLLLPAGTFLISGTLHTGYKRAGNALNSNKTLRGAGPGVTILKLGTSGQVSHSGGSGSDFPTNYPSDSYLTADTLAGSTTLTFASPPDTTTNDLAFIYALQDTSIPVVSPFGRPVLVRITGTSGNTASFYPALPYDMLAGSRFTREIGTGSGFIYGSVDGIGLEDMTIDGADSTSGNLVTVSKAVKSWIYNVEVKNVNNWGISFGHCLQTSLLHSTIHHHKSDVGGTSRNLVLMSNCTLMLVEDNIVHSGYSSFELNGNTMSAFSHNLSDRISLLTTLASDFNINHGPHGSFNTYEGNISTRIQSDGYFGSASHETLHRNWYHGTNGVYATDWDQGGTVVNNRLPITLNRYSRYFNIVGNLVGRVVSGVTWEYTNAGPGFDTTSTTSLAVGTGTKNFTFGTGLLYNDNGTCAIAYSAADPTKWMSGIINSYNSATGTCVMTATRSNGSGTVNDWVIKGGGGYGNNNLFSLGGPNIGGGGIYFDNGAIVAPQTLNIWWPTWDGRRMVLRSGTFSGATTYNATGTGPSGVADVVSYTAQMQPEFTGNNATSWIANNPSKNGTATWATPGPSQYDWLPAGPSANQELDYDVYGTAIIKDNWNARDTGIHTNEAIGSDTYPVSRIRSGSTRPAFFGTSLTYPAFDSHSPNLSFEAIPAGYRYINGTEVPGYSMDDSGGGAPATPTYTPNRLAPAMLRRR